MCACACGVVVVCVGPRGRQQKVNPSSLPGPEGPETVVYTYIHTCCTKHLAPETKRLPEAFDGALQTPHLLSRKVVDHGMLHQSVPLWHGSTACFVCHGICLFCCISGCNVPTYVWDR